MIVQTSRINADFVVEAADGAIAALVEVKNLADLTADEAAVIRWNLVMYGRVNWSPAFIMVVSQDRGFLWDQRLQPPSFTRPPTAEFPMTQVVEFYLPSFAGRRLMGSQLELGVRQWLWDLANDMEQRPMGPEEALANSGFLDVIRGGRVSSESAH
jgi:hypothetical protein